MMWQVRGTLECECAVCVGGNNVPGAGRRVRTRCADAMHAVSADAGSAQYLLTLVEGVGNDRTVRNSATEVEPCWIQ
jgi:hypothetical protein